MSNKTYDILKYIAQIVLPAVATLYFTLAQIWGLPYAEQVVGTITAIDTFMGVLLKLQSNSYSKELEDPGCLEVMRQRNENIPVDENGKEVNYTEG